MKGRNWLIPGHLAGVFAATFVMLASCASQPGKTPPAPGTTTPAAAGLDLSRLEAEADALQADIGAGVLPGAVLVVGRHGRVAWQRTLGTQGPNDATPMSMDTIFRIQSMTKPVVSVAVMQLVEQGRIGLDDPVSKYLPEYAHTTVYDQGTIRPAKSQITVRHLLTHTSGLIAVVGPPRTPLHEIWSKSGIWTQDKGVLEASRATGGLPMLADPGTLWNYGRSVDVLGALLEVVTGKPFDEALKAQLFRPLGMNDTDFYLTPQQAAGRVAQANGGRPWDPTQRHAMMFGTNGLASTTHDYLRFTMMLAGGGRLGAARILKPETLRLMTTDQLGPQVNRATFPYKTGGFGLGFGLKPEAVGGPLETRVWTWGGSDGTNFWVDPKSGVFVVYMIQNGAQGGRLQARFNQAVFEALALGSGTPVANTPVASGLDARGHLQAVPLPSSAAFTFARLDAGVQWRVGGVTKQVIFYGPGTVRVNANLGENYWTAPSLAVTGAPQRVAFTLLDSGPTLHVRSARLRIDINKSTGALRFFDANGRLYTEEKADAPQTLKPVTISGSPSLEARNVFTLQPDEAIYGLGFLGEDRSNRRGRELLLVQTNVGIVIPVLMSTRRYGVMWDTYSQMRFKDDAEGASLWAESAPGGVDYYFMAGNTPDDVVRAYRALTGEAPMYPRQAFGLFMSKERYKTQDRLLEVARTFRESGFPLDYIVQDWQYWGSDKDGSWSGMTWDPVRYPDPDGMIRQLHDMNLKLMVSVWPSIGDDTALAHELDSHGLRFKPLHWISKHARVYDAYSPLGRQIYFRHLKAGLLDKGVDALWMDGTEIEVSSAMWNAQDNIRDTKALGSNALGDFTRYLNPYSLLTTQGTYEGQRASSNKRAFTLTRSAWAGAQRTAAASWSGDIFASWKTLKQQVADGVNVTVTGNPYWTQDTGGFFVAEFSGGEKNPAWRELYARWLQFSAFNPLMRIHGTDVEREPYLFKTMDPPVYASLLDSTRLRYRLLPYTYSQAWQVTSNGYTLMRPLMMDFPDDRTTDAIDDSFLFGPSLLVHPVTRAMYHVLPPPAATIPGDVLRTPDGQPGLAGEYFEGENFEQPRSRFIDVKVDHTWPDPPLAELPPGLNSLSHFSARWQGTLTAPEDGEYEIGLEGNDGFRLKLDGETVLEDWNPGAARYKGATRSLRKGQVVRVLIEFYQADGNRVLRLAWRTPRELQAMKASAPSLDVSMKTYLPKGADWYDFWTHQRLAGGTWTTRDAPLGILPLYVRAGSIVPLGPQVQYATQSLDAPWEVRIYPGADAHFTVYEDDNETYAYEKGKRATYELVWNDRERTLTVGARQGKFAGMVRQRRLDIVLVSDGTAGGIEPARATRQVLYTGSRTSIRFPVGNELAHEHHAGGKAGHAVHRADDVGIAQ